MVKGVLVLLSLLVVFVSPYGLAKKPTKTPQIDLSLSKKTVWRREQFIVTLKVLTDDLLARLDSQGFTQNGLTIISSDLEQLEQNNQLQLTYRWVIFPFVSGDHVLKLPRIRYRPNSGRPIKLELPEKTLTVKALPIYVPPTMPVGEVELESDWKNGLLISSKKLFEWKVKAVSKGVSPQTLPAISRLLRSTESLTILPVKRSVTAVKNKEGISHQQIYQIPIKVNVMGRLDTPKLSIQYFSPESAKLKTASAKAPFVLVFNTWVLWLVSAMLVVLSVIFTRKLKLFLQPLLIRHQAKKLALKALGQSNNYQQIRTALRQYASALGWGDNITLDQFALQAKGNSEKLIKRLQIYEFSTSNVNDSKLRGIIQELVTSLK